MAAEMNSIGIDSNLNRARIKKLLTIGFVASVLTGVGDFLLGYGVPVAAEGLFEGILATAPNLSDTQLVVGGLLGFFGIFLEGLSYFGVYRLMADAAPRYAHVFRSGIFAYIWLAPAACHLNVAVFNSAYKYVWELSPAKASQMIGVLYPWFCLPAYALLVVFWVPMIAVQWKAFSEGKTPYPRTARWFTLFVGMLPCLAVSYLLGPETALGGAVGTMFLSFGNAWVFGGLLATLPPEERFAEFRASLGHEDGCDKRQA